MKNSLNVYRLAVVAWLMIAMSCYASGQGSISNGIISPDEAIAATFNSVRPVNAGLEVTNRAHRALFTVEGVQFTPLGADLNWSWRLAAGGAAHTAQSVGSIEGTVVAPRLSGPARIVYDRGNIREEYVLRSNGIEQQFIIPGPLSDESEDLVLTGTVLCDGAMTETADGWMWRNKEGAVRLGRVRVFDSLGKELTATMTVTQRTTRIEVSHSDLLAATYPVTIDPLIMAADVRLSDMGPDGDHDYDAQEAAVAYNSVNSEYLVVWAGDDTLGTVEGEFEIYGQRVDAVTGLEVGTNDFRISDMGTALDPAWDASNPTVVHNAAANEYLVVWSGDDNSGILADNEFEIYGQRLAGATGAEVGADDFRISDMGVDGNAAFDADSPAATINTVNNEYLVVWFGEDSFLPSEYEIFGQRLTAAGVSTGTNDFIISDMGPAADTLWSAFSPAVAYNGTNNEYLVVWQGEDNRGLLVEGEYEIYGQRLAGATGVAVGTDDFRVSDMGPDGNALYDAAQPAVAYGATSNRYLVAWQGDDDVLTVSGEVEIYGQFIDAASGAEVGVNDLRLSEMGPDGDPFYDAGRPAVAFDPSVNEFLVVWDGDTDGSGLVNGENEIFGQRVNAASGAETGANDFRLSDAGTDGFNEFDATLPALAFGSGRFLIAWEADTDTLALVDNELEIYGQFVLAGTGAETGTNDFRISDLGPDGDITFDARVPAVAYNSVNNEYLVVWEGDDSTVVLAEGETEIFGQRVDATTGLELGANDFRISDMGPNGDPLFDAVSPAVAYNSVQNQYLVVWAGEDNTLPLINGEFEIFGQRLDGPTGTEIGVNDFRISDMGPDGSDIYDAETPDVSYNRTSLNYLVVWSGDDNTVPLVDGESEVFGQLLDGATTAPVGVNDFRISDMGPDGDNLYDALTPAVAANPNTNEYLVVWSGEENILPLVNGEFEIYGQRLSAPTGSALGTNDFRISDMGTDGDALHDAAAPDVAFNTSGSQYLVVWAGDDTFDGEAEIYGQRLNATGAEIGTNDQRFSDVGPDGDPLWDASEPAVAYNVTPGTFVIVFEAEDNIGTLVDGESETYVQLVDASTGLETGPNDLRVSSMGLDGDPFADALTPDVAVNGATGDYLIVWSGDDAVVPMVDNEYEVYGQLKIAGGATCCTPASKLRGDVSICGGSCPTGDGITDGSDLQVYVDLVFFNTYLDMNPDVFTIAGPGTCLAIGDLNNDTTLDGGDLGVIVDYVFFGDTSVVVRCDGSPF